MLLSSSTDHACCPRVKIMSDFTIRDGLKDKWVGVNESHRTRKS